MTRANVSRYARWQLQDFMTDRGIALVLIGVLLAAPEVIMMGRLKGPFLRDPTQILLRMTTSLSIIFALVSLNGQVSNDRSKGYFRFLFAKPVSPAAFYAQQFAVWFGGLMIVVSLLIGLFAITAGPVKPWPVLWYVALAYLGFGGVGFFISTVTRRDWLVLIGFWTIAQILVSVYKDENSWIERLFFVLPPVEHLDNAGKALLRQGVVGMGDVAWILGYSAVFFVLGLYVLHKRPFHS
jgi:ABC-type transport system involved in multi-copper enzyme maturation permease subunit